MKCQKQETFLPAGRDVEDMGLKLHHVRN